MKEKQETTKIAIKWNAKKTAPKPTRTGMMDCLGHCEKNRNESRIPPSPHIHPHTPSLLDSLACENRQGFE